MKWENSDNISETLVDGLSAQLFNTDYTIDIINKNSGSENFFTFLTAFKDALTLLGHPNYMVWQISFPIL